MFQIFSSLGFFLGILQSTPEVIFESWCAVLVPPWDSSTLKKEKEKKKKKKGETLATNINQEMHKKIAFCVMRGIT